MNKINEYSRNCTETGEKYLNEFVLKRQKFYRKKKKKKLATLLMHIVCHINGID